MSLAQPPTAVLVAAALEINQPQPAEPARCTPVEVRKPCRSRFTDVVVVFDELPQPDESNAAQELARNWLTM
jgi:hypothetical protein